MISNLIFFLHHHNASWMNLWNFFFIFGRLGEVQVHVFESFPISFSPMIHRYMFSNWHTFTSTKTKTQLSIVRFCVARFMNEINNARYVLDLNISHLAVLLVTFWEHAHRSIAKVRLKSPSLWRKVSWGHKKESEKNRIHVRKWSKSK